MSSCTKNFFHQLRVSSGENFKDGNSSSDIEKTGKKKKEKKNLEKMIEIN